MSSLWLTWVQKLQAIAQTGLHYKNHPFDAERYRQIEQIAAEMLARLAQTEPEHLLGLIRHDSGHATPKVDLRGVVFRHQKILLVQERSDGLWSLPGGWADIGEPPSQGVEREVFEESGFRTKATKLLAVYDRSHPRHGHPPELHHSFKLFFRCELLEGSPTPSYETTAIDFFDRNQLPPLSLNRVMPSQIERCFEHLHHPNWPTDFD